jgi:hypothetical protein
MNFYFQRLTYWEIPDFINRPFSPNSVNSFAGQPAGIGITSNNLILPNIPHSHSFLNSWVCFFLAESLRLKAELRINTPSCDWEVIIWDKISSELLYWRKSMLRTPLKMHKFRIARRVARLTNTQYVIGSSLNSMFTSEWLFLTPMIQEMWWMERNTSVNSMQAWLLIEIYHR